MVGEGYTSAEVARLLDVKPAQVRGYVRAGFLSPARGARGELRFTFQDLVLMRTARALLAAEVPARSVKAALRKLRTQLPAGRPLSAIAVAAQGRKVIARDGRSLWQPESGQAMFDFAASEAARAVAALEPRVAAVEPSSATATEAAVATLSGRRGRGRRVQVPPPPEPARSAADWYERELELEKQAPQIGTDAARQAYRRVLALAPEHLDALVNLGRLEHEAGDLPAAEQMYRRALQLAPDDATAAFNLGVALEDQDRVEAAVTAYRRALTADPGCADAHYNLSRLYERLGRTAAAIRHLSAYRRLTE